MIEKVSVGMRRIGTFLFLLSGIALAAWLSGCGPCRKPDPPPPDPLDPAAPHPSTAVRVEIPVEPVEETPDEPDEPDEYSEEAMREKYYDNPPGVETNLVDIHGWAASRPWGSKFGGRFGERVYRQDNKNMLVRIGRVETEIARMKPQFEIGYKYETRIQHVEMLEINGYPVMINHNPISNIGGIEIILLDGYGKIDFNYQNMAVDEVMAFMENFPVEELEKKIAPRQP